MNHIFIHSSVVGLLSRFHVLSIVNCAAVNIGVCVSFWIRVLSGYMPRSGTDESHGCPIFCFLINIHTVSHSGCTNLLYHQWCRTVPFSQSLILKSPCVVRSTLCLEMSHRRDGEFDVPTFRAARPPGI